jgi:hypothetical protein
MCTAKWGKLAEKAMKNVKKPIHETIRRSSSHNLQQTIRFFQYPIFISNRVLFSGFHTIFHAFYDTVLRKLCGFAGILSANRPAMRYNEG